MFEFLHELSEPQATTGGYYALRLLEYRHVFEESRNDPDVEDRVVSQQDSYVAGQIIREIENAEQISISLLDPTRVELYSNRLKEVLDAISSHSIYNVPEIGQSVLEELRNGPSAWKNKPVYPDIRIELINDLPEYGLRSGEQGSVIKETSEPELAYVAEFVHKVEGTSVIAENIKASEVINLNEVAKESFDRAITLLNEGKIIEAEKEFRRAISLETGYVAVLHNQVLSFHERAAKGQGTLQEMQSLIEGLRFVLRLSPAYEIAKHNIAVVYLNYGVQRANENDLKTALELYHIANGISSPQEVISCLKWNFIAAYTSLSAQAQKEGKYHDAVAHSRNACAVDSNNLTRFNLGAAYTNLAGFYITQKDFDAANRMLVFAQDTGISAPQWYSNLAAVFAAKGEIDTAINLFNYSLQLAPGDEFARSNLSNLLIIKSTTETPKEIDSLQVGFISVSPLQAQPYHLII